MPPEEDSDVGPAEQLWDSQPPSNHPLTTDASVSPANTPMDSIKGTRALGRIVTQQLLTDTSLRGGL